ncbi:MAG: ImmA/IrrE family metallo-endopeptidase [Lachnospiraceae bacterium]|nr:ImmA/IrrE family metallo-endopeptidase [Lachnospiraceae bacterium]
MSWVSFRELDSLGEGLVKDYAKQTHRWNAMCFDIEGFITDYLGLNIVYETIAEEDKNKLGFCSDGSGELLVDRDGNAVAELFPAGTIVIDQYLKRESEVNRRRFTLAHEAAHAILARHIPESVGSGFQADFDRETTYSRQDILRMFSMTELCANRLGAALLMPEYRVERALRKYNNGNHIPCYEGVYSSETKQLIRRISNALGVSTSAMSNRLKELNFLDYQPLARYIREELHFGGLQDGCI